MQEDLGEVVTNEEDLGCPVSARKDDEVCVVDEHLHQAAAKDATEKDELALKNQAEAPSKEDSSAQGKEITTVLVDTEPGLQECCAALEGNECISLDLEACCVRAESGESRSKHHGQISLLQLQGCSASDPDSQPVYLVDVLALQDAIKPVLGPILEDNKHTKLIYDCRKDSEALAVQLGIRLSGTIDLQLATCIYRWKACGSSVRHGLNRTLSTMLGNTANPDQFKDVSEMMTLGPTWDKRPLSARLVAYAANDVVSLYHLYDRLKEHRVSATALTKQYLEHYSTGSPVEEEIDHLPHKVREEWLQSAGGTPGVCKHCGKKGHDKEHCTRLLLCENCKKRGHDKAHCNRLKNCGKCGKKGHDKDNCFQSVSCKFCGRTGHPPALCFKNKRCDGPAEDIIREGKRQKK